ncbi:hypothetical protein MAUB_64710 (plasmid) [Mycolicibacterium aubagnense]|uniref:Uncharacterized protein n=1 Tax=Mycolicibacterium aubagnense TaxID=319707 RepID=A0ABM7ING9_9MYCO|nr:hypothetical protein MAUB_64710 [Mycolicibacterium aubagnense]
MPARRADDQDNVCAALGYFSIQHLDEILRGVSADWTADAAGGTDAYRFGDPAGGIVPRYDQDAGSRDRVDVPFDRATGVVDRAASTAKSIGSTTSFPRWVTSPTPTNHRGMRIYRQSITRSGPQAVVRHECDGVISAVKPQWCAPAAYWLLCRRSWCDGVPKRRQIVVPLATDC